MSTFAIVVTMVLVASAITGLGITIRKYFQSRGKRLVTCPETRKPVVVHLDAAKAAGDLWKSHSTHLRLEQCSRWPERENCGQECLSQIENDPAGCRVWNIAREWYRGRSCAYCRKPIEAVHWHDHRPALLAPDKKTVQWTDIPAEKLPDVLATHSPVCWSCHIAETFRREHPDRFVDRPWERGAMGEYVSDDTEKASAGPTAQ